MIAAGLLHLLIVMIFVFRCSLLSIFDLTLFVLTFLFRFSLLFMICSNVREETKIIIVVHVSQ